MGKKDPGLISPESNEESRRDFLKKAGKMALYTPPAIMLLMQPSRHALACSVRPQKYNGYLKKSRRHKSRRFKRSRDKGGRYNGFRD